MQYITNMYIFWQATAMVGIGLRLHDEEDMVSKGADGHRYPTSKPQPSLAFSHMLVSWSGLRHSFSLHTYLYLLNNE